MSSYYIGLNVVEVDGPSTPALAGASTSVAAFNILTRRGVPNRPARINNIAQFQERFGGFFTGGLGAYLVNGFFQNGGRTAYINRVVAAGVGAAASAAEITLLDSAGGGGANTLRLRTGFRGEVDPGDWGNTLYVRVQPTNVTASRLRETAPAFIESAAALPATTNMTGLPPLLVRIDGEATPTTLTFLASDFLPDITLATPTQMVNAINRQTHNLTASLNAGKLRLTSTGAVAAVRHDWTSLEIPTANASLGFPAVVATVRGTTATPAQNGAQLASAEALQVGDAVLVTDGTRSARVKVLTIVSDTGNITWTPNIANINTYDRFLMTAAPIQFDLTIANNGTEAENIVETFTGLAMESELPNYAPRRLNDPLRGSRYVVATDLNSASPVGVDTPTQLAFTRLNPGTNGTMVPADFIGDAAAHTGFNAFDAYDIQLLTCERTDPAIVTAALAYCARRADCMYVGSVPQGFVEANQVGAYTQTLRGKKVYGALYGPWIRVFDPIGAGTSTPMITIPPSGHVMGVYARIENTRGVWKAPAGDEATLLGVLDVEYRLSQAEHDDLVRNSAVNGLRVTPRSGIVVDASRTLSSDTRWLWVNIRLLFNYLESSLKDGLSWVRQEPNRDTLWNAVKFGTVTPFLMTLYRQGAFGAGSPDQVFTVICDATNNPPDQVDLGNFKLEVYIYPSKPAETIVITVGQRPSGATVTES